MKKCFTLCLFALLFFWGAPNGFGQQTVQLGSGTLSSSYVPNYYLYNYSYSQAIYTKDELNAQGVLSSVAIRKIYYLPGSSVSTEDWEDWVVYLGNTTKEGFSSTSDWIPVSSLTKVFDGKISPTVTSGQWMEITLSTPFIWDGVSNLVVAVDENTGTYGNSPSWRGYTLAPSTSGENKCIYYYSDPNNPDPANPPTANSRTDIAAQIQIEYSFLSEDDAGISAISSPVYFCPGTEDIKVRVFNYGTNLIDSVMVGWELDGVAQTPYSLTQPLDTLGGSGDVEREITLGSHTFTNAPVQFKAWTYLPNGVADTVNINDTLTVTLQASLSGTYTIDAGSAVSATNYQSFGDLIDDLELYGICGPVTVNVVSGSGPYNELINIGEIPGASATNTIRFNGNGETVEDTTTTSDRQLLTLNGAKYVTIDSLNFKALSTTYGWGALITGGSEYDSIMRCTFDLSSITSTSSANSSGICFSGSATTATTAGTNGTHCYIGYNHIKGNTGAGSSYYGIAVAGTSDSNIIEHNLVENFYYYGIYNSGATGTKILYNDVNRATKTSVTTFYGIYTTGVTPGVQIIGNRVHSPGGTNGGTSTCYAIYLLGDGTATEPVLVANNAVYDMNQGGIARGIYLSTAPYNLIYNNTINFDQNINSTSANYGISTTGTNTGVEIKNNNVSITAGSTGTKYGFYYSGAFDDAQMNNFYVNSTQSGTQNYGYYSGAHATQAAFQSAYPALEVGSPEVDPQFVNAATGDLTPQSTSLLGQGLNLTTLVPQDINGMPRPATPTIGAFEQPPVGNDNAGVLAFISPEGNFCADSQMVSVAIYNAGINNITSVQVNWSVNGVTQTPVAYTGTLVPLTSSTGQYSDTVALGNAYFSNTTPTDIVVWTSLPNGVADTETSNDSLSGDFQAAQYVVTVASDTICVGDDAIMELSPNSGYNPGDLTWQSSSDGVSWTDIANSDDVSYIDSALASSKWYRVRVGGANGCYSDSLQVVVMDLTIDSVLDGENCGPGTVTLEAFGTPGADYKWYTSDTSETPVGTGSSFTTPSIANSTTYWVSSFIGGGSGSVGPVNPSSVGTAGGYTASTTYVTYFTVHLPTTITSVDIFPNSTGQSGQLQITDESTGTIVGTYNFTTTTSGSTTNGQTIPINESLPPGDYSIGMANTSVSMYRNTSGASFPYSTPEISITGTGFTTATYYYYFYNMQYSSGCESPREPVEATILPAPEVFLGNDTVFCSTGGGALTLDAGNPGMSYLWSTGDTTQTITSSASISDYSVTVTAPNGCTASDTIQITYGVNPTLVLPSQIEFCDGSDTVLDAGNAGGSYLWSTGATTQTINVQSAGSYHVEITSPTGCTLSDTVDVTVLAAPVVDLGADTILCDGDTLVLDAGNSGATYAWSNSETTQTVSVTDTGAYYVLVTEASGCSATDTILVEYGALPVETLSASLDLCIGDTATLDAGNAGSTFYWNTGDNSQTIDVYSGGNYSVTVTNDVSGCSIEMNTLVNLIPLPLVNLGVDTGFCSGDGMTLDAGNSGSLFSWNTGDSTQLISVIDSGTYSVTVTSVPYGCVNSDTIHLAFNPLPNIVGITGTIQNDGSYIFTATGVTDAITYLWDFGDGDTSSAISPNHTFPATGEYTVVLTVTNDCGSDTSAVDVEYIALGIGEFYVEDNQLLLFPNPARDLITLKNEGNHKMNSIVVYNVLGQEVVNLRNVNGNQHQVDVSALAPGIYNMKVVFENDKVAMRRFEIRK